ncbi:hypothetical protein LCGC14_2046970 [marine sediment metagenome]|uniref:Uncharacterized protein n=1 Tax=marine sediment metagenome TaxID=412755 RepID=A0A0F9H3K4_9ZZZZ
MSFTDFLENELLDHVFAAAAFVAPVTTFIGLSTTTPADDGTNITEPPGGAAYARVSKTNNLTNWPAASGGAKSNGTAVTFTTATGDWGTVVAIGIFDAVTAGNLLAWADLTTNKAVNDGDTAEFAANDIDITLD